MNFSTNYESTIDSLVIPAQLARFAADCMSGMLGLPLDVNQCDTAIDVEKPTLQATIRIGGDYQLEMRLIASVSLATRIACAMFDASPNDLGEFEVRDALGEVVNVVAGALKSSIKMESSLGIPSVGLLKEGVPEGICMTFPCDGETLTFLILEY